MGKAHIKISYYYYYLLAIILPKFYLFVIYIITLILIMNFIHIYKLMFLDYELVCVFSSWSCVSMCLCPEGKIAFVY